MATLGATLLSAALGATLSATLLGATLSATPFATMLGGHLCVKINAAARHSRNGLGAQSG